MPPSFWEDPKYSTKENKMYDRMDIFWNNFCNSITKIVIRNVSPTIFLGNVLEEWNFSTAT